MNYWLVKSEPFKYSWDLLEKDGQTFWDGVRNFAARNHLRSMKKGDQVFFYHSNEGLEIVGIAKVIKEAAPDPTATEGDWVGVELAPVKRLRHPVSLAQIKLEPALASMALLRLSRLSVQPVLPAEWEKIISLSAKK